MTGSIAVVRGLLLSREPLMMLLSGAESLISLTDGADIASLSSVSLTVLVCAFMRGGRKADEFMRETDAHTDRDQKIHTVRV